MLVIGLICLLLVGAICPTAVAKDSDDAPTGRKCKDADMDVRAFVLQRYFQGVPRDAASRYTEKDAAVLLDMMKHPEKKVADYWAREYDSDESIGSYLPEIVTTVCYIGSEVAVQPLLEFVNGQHGDQSSFEAKNAVLIHLGDLVNKTKNEEATKLLMQVASERRKQAELVGPRLADARLHAAASNVTPPSIAELMDEVAVSAMQGLALTGTKDAEQFLNELKSESTFKGALASKLVREEAAVAAEDCRIVRTKGWKSLYDKAR